MPQTHGEADPWAGMTAGYKARMMERAYQEYMGKPHQIPIPDDPQIQLMIVEAVQAGWATCYSELRGLLGGLLDEAVIKRGGPRGRPRR